MILRCTRCERALGENERIYVVNRFAWCDTCFSDIILPQMTMTVKDYFKYRDSSIEEIHHGS